MNFRNLSLDYYSGFEGDTEIRLYACPPDADFNSFYKNAGSHQIKQGQNNTYHFSSWQGYFDALIHLLLDTTAYAQLPSFVRNWNECKGWSDIRNVPERIPSNDLEWLINWLNTHTKAELRIPTVSTTESSFRADLLKFIQLSIAQNHTLWIIDE